MGTLDKDFRYEVEKIKNKYRNEEKCKCGEDSIRPCLECCPDNYVGYFDSSKDDIDNLWFKRELRKENKADVSLTDRKIAEITNDNEAKRIIIILESPHIDEYKPNEDGVEPASALGCTGIQLDKKFIDVVKDKVNPGKYHVILMNAIQYQCSFGKSPKIFRDRMFLSMWMKESTRQDFCDRLKRYKPSVIINLCTKGNHEDDCLKPPRIKPVIDKKYYDSIEKNQTFFTGKETTLKEEVNKVIENNIIGLGSKIKLFEGPHPSSWRTVSNTWIKFTDLKK